MNVLSLKTFFVSLLTLVATALGDPRGSDEPRSPDSRFEIGECLVRDDFNGDLSLWKWELQKGGTVAAREGALEIDVPSGGCVWLKTELSGPLLISYDAIMVSAGGPNDRVSDLNCFWMAQDARSPADIFATPRSGKFSDYDQLKCYYVGEGGNTNTTTRFRRYIGEKGNRPLLPEHDLAAKEFLLRPNISRHIELLAAGSTIGYFQNGQKFFTFHDSQPYTAGWFAFRTVTSHLKIKNFRVYRLTDKVTSLGADQRK